MDGDCRILRSVPTAGYTNYKEEYAVIARIEWTDGGWFEIRSSQKTDKLAHTFTSGTGGFLYHNFGGDFYVDDGKSSGIRRKFELICTKQAFHKDYGPGHLRWRDSHPPEECAKRWHTDQQA